MMRPLKPSWSLFVSGWALLSGIACSGTSSVVGSGGSESAGGSQNTGGGAVQGGTTSTAGAPGIGGAPTGGRAQTGGVTNTGIANTGGAVISTGGQAQTGGAPGATGGSKAATGGTSTAGGNGSTGGSKASGGATTAGASATGGSKAIGGAATGGAPTTGGTKATGGAATGGAATGGSKATGGAAATGGTNSGTCGSLNTSPFSCKFAWGDVASGTNVVPASHLNFSTAWVGYEANGGLASASATATNSACDGCTFVTNVLKASGTPLPAFYAYFIGYQANLMGGYGDCNTHAAPNLCTNGAQWIRDHRALVLNMYAQYAKAVYAKAGSRPVIWLLEGDFVQYSYSTQTNALSYAELGQLARDITCAIKSNEPNAIVAANHSPWLATSIATGFWAAQPLDVLDLVWVQGRGDQDLFHNNGNNPTETFSWVRSLTGKKMLAETSYAGSSSSDNYWTTTTAANINARIASGVLGVLVNYPPSNYSTAIASLSPSLNTTCN